MTETAKHRNQIWAVLVRYATAIDTKDWTLLESCFVDEASFATLDFTLYSRSAIVDYMRDAHQALSGSRHRLTNLVLDVTAAEYTAHSQTYLDALLVQDRPPADQTLNVVGTYHDKFRHIKGDGWKIAERRFERLLIVGNVALISSSAP